MLRTALPRLRRSLPLLLLALFAWALMTGAVWAQTDCCAPAGMGEHAMGMAHADHQGGHHATSDHADHATHGMDACSCGHACAAIGRVESVVVPASWYGATPPLAAVADAPQPAGKPPLRPPLS